MNVPGGQNRPSTGQGARCCCSYAEHSISAVAPRHQAAAKALPRQDAEDRRSPKRAMPLAGIVRAERATPT